MAALRSLEAELAGAEQHVDNLRRCGLRDRWQRDAFARAVQQVRRIQAAIAARAK